MASITLSSACGTILSSFHPKRPAADDRWIVLYTFADLSFPRRTLVRARQTLQPSNNLVKTVYAAAGNVILGETALLFVAKRRGEDKRNMEIGRRPVPIYVR